MAKDFFKIRKGIVLKSVPSDPSPVDDGAIWYNSTEGKFKKREDGQTVLLSDASEISSPTVTVNFDGSDANAEGAGLIVDRVSTNGSLLFEAALASKWKAGLVGSEVELANVSSAQTLTNKTIDADNNTISNIDNDEIKAAAGIVYSKLNLSDSIVNADINSVAAIAYSKLSLSDSIVNADINSAAAIAYSKLAALTANRVLQSDGSGFISASSITNTELGYLSGVSSAIQTQLNARVVGPASATANAIVRYDSTTGKLVKDSSILIDDTNNITGVVNLSMAGDLSLTGSNKVIQLNDSNGIMLNANAQTAATNGMYAGATDGRTFISGGTGINDGGAFVGYGSTHATLANRARIRLDDSDRFDFQYSSGSILTFHSASAEGYYLNHLNSDGFASISGDNSSGTGANLQLYGSSHATKANILEFRANTSVTGSISAAGLWTLGASGGTQTHAINGALSLLTVYANMAEFSRSSTSAAGLKLANSDGHWWFGLGVTEAWEVRYNGNSAGTLFHQITTAGAHTIGTSGGAETHAINGKLNLVVPNDTNNILQVLASGTGIAQLDIEAQGTGAAFIDILSGGDDSYIRFRQTTAAEIWTMGLDDSDGDSFKISDASGLGSNERFKITTAGAVSLGSSGSNQTHVINGILSIARSDTSAESILGIINNPNTGAVSNGAHLRWDFSDTSGNSVDAGYIGFIKEQTFTSTSTTQDSSFVASISLNGARTEAIRYSSAGLLSLNGDTDTGFSNPTSNVIALTSGGVEMARLSYSSGAILQFQQASAADAFIQCGVADAGISISGSSASSAGRNIYMYGQSHATKASVMEFRRVTTVEGSIDGSGKWTLGASGGAQSHVANGYQWQVTAGRSGGNVQLVSYNTSNTANSGAELLLEIAGTSGGDPLVRFQIDGGGNTWALGADNSDNDTFKLSDNTSLGTNDYFTVTTGGIVTIGASGGSQTHSINGGLLLTQRFANGGALGANAMFKLNGNTLSGVSQYAVEAGTFTVNSNATTLGVGFLSAVTTEDASFTLAALANFYSQNITKGSASTITRRFGYRVDTPTGGTNNAAISDNIVFTGDWFINSTNTNPSLLSGIVNCSAGIRTKISTADVSNPPTDAELDSAFGTPGTVGSGFMALVDDNGAGTAGYIVWSDGTNWWHAAGTKAT